MININIKQKLIVKNTLYILFTNFLIRCWGLFNRIVTTRFLGLTGMSLDVLITPTVFLFITFSTLSINISTTKVVSEGIETKNVFVSHYHKDEENIRKLKDLLSDEYCIKNYSVTTNINEDC